jgi:dipeptidyl aminopeptidase/acylaminoacyl peptidase
VLPPAGERRLLARVPGGVSGPVVARETGTVLLAGSRLAGAGPDGPDAERRATRKDRRVTAILHTGFPIRHWDHELGAESPRLLVTDRDGEPRDLAPDAGFALDETDYSISADAVTVAAGWRERAAHGRRPRAVALIDVASGERTVLAAGPGRQYDSPRIAPDGSRVALVSFTQGSYEVPEGRELRIVPAKGGGKAAVPVLLGDLWATEWEWSADSQTLYVAGGLHGRGAVVAVDPATGAVRRRLAADAAYSSLCPAPDGRSVYALRSTVDSPPGPVRLDTGAADQRPVPLSIPAPVPAPPGRLEEVQAEVAGTTVRAWLAVPDGAGPAPLMLWVHGGPFSSFNAWSWRWNPWVAVAHGWAVLLPDPARFGRPDEHPDWYAENSPHRFADRIRTPMLVTHGNRDYRVPVSEALRLWWDLVSRWDGDPDEMPHRFLNFTGQNHWILAPADAEVWYATVLGFCGQHVLGRPRTRPDLL